MECEICGAGADRKAEIEGVLLNVCKGCAGFGKETVRQEPRILSSAKLPDEMQTVLTNDFPSIIRKARMKKQLSQEQLAFAIKEKLSLVKRIEDGWSPPIQVARKIERFLGVKVLDAIKEANGNMEFAKNELTIGDIAIMKRKANKP